MPLPSVRRFSPPECPVCGAEVPPAARSCPECGADERTGWDEDATRYDGVDLPASAFEDENRASRSHAPRPMRAGPHPLWLLVGAALLIALLGRALALF